MGRAWKWPNHLLCISPFQTHTGFGTQPQSHCIRLLLLVCEACQAAAKSRQQFPQLLPHKGKAGVADATGGLGLEALDTSGAERTLWPDSCKLELVQRKFSRAPLSSQSHVKVLKVKNRETQSESCFQIILPIHWSSEGRSLLRSASTGRENAGLFLCHDGGLQRGDRCQDSR